MAATMGQGALGRALLLPALLMLPAARPAAAWDDQGHMMRWKARGC